MRNEELLNRVEEERNIIDTAKEGKLNVLVTSRVGTGILKHVPAGDINDEKRREDEEKT